MKRSSPTLWLLLGLACLLAGCDDDSSPTSPDTTLVFEGRITDTNEIVHSFDIVTDGSTRVELSDIRAVLLDTTVFDPNFLALSIGLGQFDAQNECVQTALLNYFEGDSFLFGLTPGPYCLTVTGIFPDESVIDYTLTIELPT